MAAQFAAADSSTTGLRPVFFHQCLFACGSGAAIAASVIFGC